jgi:hypothetical protein
MNPVAVAAFIRVELIRQYYPGKILAFTKSAQRLPDPVPG